MPMNEVSTTPVVPRNAPPRRPLAPPPSDEIDLLAYGATLWRYRYVLLLSAIVVAAVTYIINRRIEPTYEARFRLMGTETGLEDTPGSRLSIVAFRELVESPTLVAALLSEFRLDGPPRNLTAGRFLRSHLSVEVIRDSTIIEVAVRLTDRDLVVALARRYAERVVETAQRLNTEGVNYTADRIREERDAALTRLNAAAEAMEAYQRKAQIELLRKDVDTLVDRRPDVLDLVVRIQGARARLQQAEAELGRQDRVRAERRSVDSFGTTPTPVIEKPQPQPPAQQQPPQKADGKEKPPPAPRPAASRPPTAKPEDLRIRSELLDPYVNPVYEALTRDVSGYRAELAGLEQERKELVSRLQFDAPSTDKLTRLYEAQAALDVLTRNVDVAREAYLNAAKKYEDARLQSTIRSPRLQILDAALPPDAPVAPRSLRNTVAATMLALALLAVALLVWDATRSPAAERT